jgi:hypothetical protein
MHPELRVTPVTFNAVSANPGEHRASAFTRDHRENQEDHMRWTALLVPVAVIAFSAACTDLAAQEKHEPTTVDVATDVRVSDGTLTWVEGKIDTSGPAEPNVAAVGDEKKSATFADDVELLTPQGCTAPLGDMKVDKDGLGQTPCTTDAYQDVDHYAPRIWLDGDGRVTKVADRYHP